MTLLTILLDGLFGNPVSWLIIAGILIGLIYGFFTSDGYSDDEFLDLADEYANSAEGSVEEAVVSNGTVAALDEALEEFTPEPKVESDPVSTSVANSWIYRPGSQSHLHHMNRAALPTITVQILAGETMAGEETIDRPNICINRMLMKKFVTILLSVLCLIDVYSNDFKGDTIIVGTCVSPPFVIQTDDGYEGVCIDLWDNITDKLGISYKIIDMSDRGFNKLVDAVDEGEIDMALTSLTINSKRAEKVDFMQPFFITGLSIAMSPTGEASWIDTLSGLFNVKFMKSIGSLWMILFIVGALFWVIEKQKNEDFDKGPLMGLFDGFYFASVVMTTVGFGDKAAKTIVGKFLAIIWMFVALIITSFFTGNIAASITVDKIDSRIEGLADLQKLKVATLKGSTGEDFLYENGIKFIGYEDAAEALNDIKDGKLDAFVFDRPVIQYIIQDERLENFVKLAPEIYDKQYYGFAVPHDKYNNIRSSVNTTLLDEIKSQEWQVSLEKWGLN